MTELCSYLQPRLRSAIAADLQLHEAIRLTGGASRLSWLLTGQADGRPFRAVLRTVPASADAAELASLVREAHVLAAAHDAGVTCPRVLLTGSIPMHIILGEEGAAAGDAAADQLGEVGAGAAGRAGTVSAGAAGRADTVGAGAAGRPESAGRLDTAGQLDAAEISGSAEQPHGGAWPFAVLEFLPGESIPRRILRDDAFAAAREELAAQLGRTAAAIHATPVPAEVPTLDDPVDSLIQQYRQLGVHRPALTLGLRELDRRRPPPAPRRGLVHGDFRMGNLLITPAGLSAVLDWELAHLGDPYEDLGYVCMRAWRFAGPGRVAGVGSVDQLLDAYRSAAGHAPDEQQLNWWQARATAWWGLGCITQLQRARAGADTELELLVIGRRVAEQEHDLLALLYPDIPAADIPDFEPGRSKAAGLFDSPTAQTLGTGLARSLSLRAHSTDDPGQRYELRVAAGAAEQLARQAAIGSAAEEWYAEQLAGLSVSSEAELDVLAARLADTSGTAAPTREVISLLKAAARIRLAISRPGYADAADSPPAGSGTADRPPAGRRDAARPSDRPPSCRTACTEPPQEAN